MDQPRRPGRSFYAAPGPTNVPDSVLAAIGRATTDFMGPDFLPVYQSASAGLGRLIGTTAPLFFYASSGHGAWEATLVNLFSAGDCVLMPDTGVFSGFWTSMAEAHGLVVQTIPADPREGIAMQQLEQALRADGAGRIKAVLVVHNDTISGLTLPVEQIRACMDAAGHPALLVLDVISSLGCLPVEMDAGRVDVAIGSCQKGLMMPPGLAFTAVNAAGMAAHRNAGLARAYWDWTRMQGRPHAHSSGTLSSAMFAGLDHAIGLIEAEGLPRVLARHVWLGRAVRAAVAAWGGEGEGPALYCRRPERASNSVSTVWLPEGCTASPVRQAAARHSVTLGGDLWKLEDRVFRIGHMGDLNAPMVLGVLGVVELAMGEAGVPHAPGLAAALAVLAEGYCGGGAGGGAAGALPPGAGGAWPPAG